MRIPAHRLATLLSGLFPVAAALAQGGWSPPVLETTLNTPQSDTGPHLSFDGLTLHFASFRSSNWEIWSATRTAPGQPWSAPTLVVGPSDPAQVDDQPFLSFGGQELWFASTRPGGAGSFEILVSQLVAPGTWGAPTFVTELNSSAADSAPSLTADGLEVYFLSTGWGNPAGNNNSIFRATRASAGSPFGTPTLVAELSTLNTHRDAEISPDGLAIVYTEFVSPRLKVMYAERTNRSAAFGTPVVWTEFDTVGSSQGVFGFTLGPSRNEAVLAAGFAAAAGSQELMTTRFDGLTHVGIASLSTTMALNVRDSTRPGAVYLLGASLGNTGFTLGTRTVPLDPDFLLLGTLGISVPPWSTGFGGVLDAGGEAQGTLTDAGGFLFGMQVYVGAFSLDTTQPFNLGMISNSFRVEFQ